jgi:hypothetical protein
MLPTPVLVCPVYASYGQSPYVATFHESSIELDRVTTPEKKGSRHNLQHAGWPICGSIPSFFSQANQWSSGESQNIYQQLATRLTGPVSPARDRYVQYLLMGANRTVLNWHKWGLQPWRCRLSTYHSSTFPTNYPHFPLVAPPGLHFNQVLTTKPKCWVWGPYGRHVVFRPLDHLS